MDGDKLVNSELLRDFNIPYSIVTVNEDDTSLYVYDENKPVIEERYEISFADTVVRYSIDNKLQTRDEYFGNGRDIDALSFVSFMLEGFGGNVRIKALRKIMYSLYEDIYVTNKMFDLKEIQNENFMQNIRIAFRNCMNEDMYTNINKAVIKPPKKIKTVIFNWFLSNRHKETSCDDGEKGTTRRQKKLREIYTASIPYWRKTTKRVVLK